MGFNAGSKKNESNKKLNDSDSANEPVDYPVGEEYEKEN